MQRKQTLASAFGIQNENWGSITMHFSEIIKFQFGKEHHTLLCILQLFTNNLLINFLRKLRGYPHFLFGFQ